MINSIITLILNLKKQGLAVERLSSSWPASSERGEEPPPGSAVPSAPNTLETRAERNFRPDSGRVHLQCDLTAQGFPFLFARVGQAVPLGLPAAD